MMIAIILEINYVYTLHNMPYNVIMPMLFDKNNLCYNIYINYIKCMKNKNKNCNKLLLEFKKCK